MQYLIRPTSEDLMHKSSSHKYVDKKWKNGRWIYYYTKKPTSMKARVGVYAKEKLNKQKLESAVTVGNMKNDSREQAMAKQIVYNAERKKVDKAQSDYNKTAMGRLEKFASTGMKYLEKLGLVSTNTKTVTSNLAIPRTTPTTSLPASGISSIKPTKITKTARRKRRR